MKTLSEYNKEFESEYRQVSTYPGQEPEQYLWNFIEAMVKEMLEGLMMEEKDRFAQNIMGETAVSKWNEGYNTATADQNKRIKEIMS